MNRLAPLLAIFSLLAACTDAQGQTVGGTIGIYFDEAAQTCAAVVESNTWVTAYVVATLDSTVSDGITGAEFRIKQIPQGWPAGWLVYVYPAPEAAVVLGTPADATGVVMTFPSCQTGTGGHRTLFTIDMYATTLVSDYRLLIALRSPPTNPRFPFITLTACDSTFTKSAAQPADAIINATPGHQCDDLLLTMGTEVAVADSLGAAASPTAAGRRLSSGRVSWSALKSLYR